MSELAVRDVEVLAPGEKGLAELADIANREHENYQNALHSALMHAIRVGEALLEAHRKVGVGAWQQWADEHLTFSRTYASRFERLAAYKDLLPPEAFKPFRDIGGSVRQPSIHRACFYLRGLPPVLDGRISARTSEELRAEIRGLRHKGMKYADIANAVGVSKSLCQRICKPGAERRHNEAQARYRKRLRAAKKALKEQEQSRLRRRAVKQAGGAMAEAYSLCFRLSQKIEVARGEEDNPDTKNALDEALTKLPAVEYALHRALGVS